VRYWRLLGNREQATGNREEEKNEYIRHLQKRGNT